jgi:hypothetical protein
VVGVEERERVDSASHAGSGDGRGDSRVNGTRRVLAKLILSASHR